jgi:hypothetical protein
MNPVKDLLNQRQSLWLDYIDESFIQSGELERLVNGNEVRGVTSNPRFSRKRLRAAPITMMYCASCLRDPRYSAQRRIVSSAILHTFALSTRSERSAAAPA